MALITSQNHLSSTTQRASFSKATQKWLLRRERLEEISRILSTVIQSFKSNNGDISNEELPDLQDYCFKSVFEMCEQGSWVSLQKIVDVIQGLTDSSGNTVLSIYIQRDEYIPNKDIAESREREQIKRIVNSRLALVLSKGNTPLHIALKLGKTQAYIDGMLLDGCGKALDLDCKGRLPVHIAVKRGRAEVIGWLIPTKRQKDREEGDIVPNIPYHSNKHNLDLSSLTLAVLKGEILCLDEVKKREKIHLSAVRVSSERMTLLHLAIHANQFEMLKYLLTKYFEETQSLLNIADSNGYAPIILAAILGDVHALTLLIRRGADIESCDYKGRTSVYHAAMKKQMAVIQILAAYNADLHSIDLEGKTPIALLEMKRSLL